MIWMRHQRFIILASERATMAGTKCNKFGICTWMVHA